MNVKVKREKQKNVRKMYRHSNIPLKAEKSRFSFCNFVFSEFERKIKESEIDLFRRQLIIDLKVIL